MTDTKRLSFEEVCNLLSADFEEGKLYWRARPESMFVSDTAAKLWNAQFAGKEAMPTCCGTHGYRQGKILYRTYKAHRVLWMMYTGSWPEFDIDHINGDRGDNRISNLRAVSRAENLKNRRRFDRSTSGVTGVSWHKKSGKWQAHIRVDGVSKYLGCFADLTEAAAARKAADIACGFHENHGRIA